MSERSTGARPISQGRPAKKGRAGGAGDATDKVMNLLDKILSETDKHIGRGAVMRMGAMPDMEIETFPSGSILLDRALGVGGYPRGRVVEVFGPEASGKTTLCRVKRLGWMYIGLGATRPSIRGRCIPACTPRSSLR